MNTPKRLLIAVAASSLILFSCHGKASFRGGSAAKPSQQQTGAESPAPAPTSAPPSTSSGPPTSTPAAQPAVPAPATTTPTSAQLPTSPAPPPPSPVSAPAPEVPPAPPPPPPIVIPAGTVIHVSLVTPVGSKTSQTGQPFDASLAESIVVGGKAIVAKGAPASGQVTEAHAAGRFKGGATLNLVLTSLAIQGEPRTIQTELVTAESKGKGKRSAGMVGGGGAGGALIGGLAGGGKGAAIGALAGVGAGAAGAAFTGNRDINLPSETALTFELQNSITVHPRE